MLKSYDNFLTLHNETMLTTEDQDATIDDLLKGEKLFL